jgi:hypothetical protein
MGETPAGVTRLARPEDTDGGICDDAALIARSIGVPECFALLFDRHGPAIHSNVARRLGQDAADDLAAEVFLIAFQRRRAYDGAYGNARLWLYGIATNLVGRRRRDEVRLFRATARSGEISPAESVAEQVTNRVAAQAGVQDVKHGTGDFGGGNDLWLPADPAKLRAVFLAHPQPGAKGRNNVIAAGALTVMNADSVRPAVRAAAFRVLASVPGVRMRPGVTDLEGQTGTAVWQDSWIGAYLRYETTFVIIDPQSRNLLGSESVAQTPVAGAVPGTVLFYSATTSARWTNHLPRHTP